MDTPPPGLRQKHRVLVAADAGPDAAFGIHLNIHDTENALGALLGRRAEIGRFPLPEFAGVRIEPADVIPAGVAVPDITLAIHVQIVNNAGLARNGVNRHHGLGALATGARQGFQRVIPGVFAATEVECGQVIGDVFRLAPVPHKPVQGIGFGHDLYAFGGGMIGLVGLHALDDRHESFGVMGGTHDPLQGVAHAAIDHVADEQVLFLFGAREAAHPLQGG